MTATLEPEAGPVPWDPGHLMSKVDFDLLDKSAEYRRLLTRLDPMLFALVYLPHHLRSITGQVSFCEFHYDLAQLGRQWLRRPTEMSQCRDAVLAPRGAGKSTWAFLILPMWAGAHGHLRFVSAFADTGLQAETHLGTFKRELDDNKLLRADFPDLVTPGRRPGGVQISDNRGMLYTKSKFIFTARGIDSTSLGLKVGELRPELLLMDDIEPDESNYSAYQKTQRLNTVLDAVFQLNVYARVLMVGTTTMHGSIMHDVVRSSISPDEESAWVEQEKIRVHYHAPIITKADGSEDSMWPEKWSIADLNSIRHTRSFRKNYQNLPDSGDGGYWTEDDFVYGSMPTVTRKILSVDPAVTSKAKSDYTGLAVVGYSPAEKRCQVEGVWQVKLAPKLLRERILSILSQDPTIKLVYIEVNQGGDTWDEVMDPLPVPIKTVHQSEPKDVRAARVLDYYQHRWVLHTLPHVAYEEQAKAFPKALHDDMVDAVGSGLHFFLAGKKSVQSGPVRRTRSYV